MAFIEREALPASLRTAYDKAAKGIKDDKTRPENFLNNPKIIDSECELAIFRQEFETMYRSAQLDQFTYDALNKKITDLYKQIQSIRDLAKPTKMTMNISESEIHSNDSKVKDARQRFEKYKQEHPVKYTACRALGWLTFGTVKTEYQKLKEESYYGFSDQLALLREVEYITPTNAEDQIRKLWY